MNFEPRFAITHSISNSLSKIDRAQGFLEGARLSEEWIQERRDRALVLEAHHTTHIEGSQLTLDQSEKLLSGKHVENADPDDIQEVLNYQRAFEFVSQPTIYSEPMTEETILKIHELLVEGVRGGEASPGRFREKQNWIVDMSTMKAVYTPSPPNEVPGLMDEMIEWLNDKHDFHPVLLAGIAQFQFVHIHPFLDGNGRAARLLSTLSLYRAGYDFKQLFSISEYYDRDRPAYYEAIQSVRENKMDMTGWLEYFCHGLAIQTQEVQESGIQYERIAKISEKYSLSNRQMSIMKIIIENREVGIKDLDEIFQDINRRTLQRELKKMVEIGLLKISGHTNQLHYHIEEI
jgi:Fic family protein